MAAIISIRKKMWDAERSNEADFDVGSGRRFKSGGEMSELLGRLPPREFRELDIELGVLQLG
jgi:hypothetical protein